MRRSAASAADCLKHTQTAERLELQPGDTLVSSPETIFDLAGVYPLKMKVVGVLARSHTRDDLAIFVDVKTAWVIQGLGHGHDDVAKTNDKSVVLKRSVDNVVANAKLVQFTEITEANLDSFHFHGDLGVYPLTAVIVIPRDTKSGTILRGRYLNAAANHQIVEPKQVIDGLLENIFRIKNVLDAVIAIVGFATMLAIVLVFALSLRLRQREINTIFKLGCSRMTIAHLLAAEIIIIVLISGVLCAALVWGVDHYSSDLVRAWFLG